MERRLAAVMIADVVGYGRLSQVDEEGTRARFHADLKKLFEPSIAAHRGRLVKTMGDGLLMEFQSIVDALRCAVEIQQEKARRNDTEPNGRRIEFRIGINLGDIIVEGDDIHGDGVNIADRIQALAEPGGIAISGTAYDHVKAKLPIGYISLGEQKVKSIAEPVRVYRVSMAPSAAGKTVGAPRRYGRWRVPAAVAVVVLPLIGAGVWWQPWKQATAPSVAETQPSLVVLPFDNLSSEAEQGYLADGITEDLTTELARTPGLLVISRNAAFGYKGTDLKPAQIADELGVRYLLEGSIRRAGDDFRINAQLIDGRSSGHLWAERFDGVWKDVFSLQDQVIDKVTDALRLRLVAGPRNAETPGATTVPAAYDLYLRAYGLDYGKFPSEAASLLQQAVALDPSFGQAWAELAWVYWINMGSIAGETALKGPGEMIARIKEFLGKAEQYPSSSYYQIVADLLVWQRKSDEAIAAAERAIALNPSDQFGYEEMSTALVFSGRALDARRYLDGAARVDPKARAGRHLLAGLIAFSMDGFEDAVASLRKAAPQDLSTDSMKRQRLLLLMAAHAHLGQLNEAASARSELQSLAGNAELTVLRAMHNLPFKQPVDRERLRAGLTKAGLVEFPFGMKPQDQLAGEDVRSLVLGHELRGQLIAPQKGPYVRTTSANGAAKVSAGSYYVGVGRSSVEQGFVCTLFDAEIEVTCAAIFRNPEGSRSKQDEYFWVTPSALLSFSVAN